MRWKEVLRTHLNMEIGYWMSSCQNRQQELTVHVQANLQQHISESHTSPNLLVTGISPSRELNSMQGKLHRTRLDGRAAVTLLLDGKRFLLAMCPAECAL